PLDALGDPLPAGAVARLGSARLKSGSYIEALAFSPDGRRLACWAGYISSHKGQLTLWEVATGRLERRVEVSKAEVGVLRWLPDGRGAALLRVKYDEYYVWDFADPTAPVPRVADSVENSIGYSDGTLLAAAISPDGRWLAAGRVARQNQAMPVEVWELDVN